MDIKKILYPTDLSNNSLKALPYARSLAEKYGAEITLLYVGFDLKNYFPAFGEPTDNHEIHYLDWESKEAEKRLQKLCADELGGCPALQVEIKLGKPSEQILTFIHGADIDLVVMATHGAGAERDGDKDYPFGSVSEKVVRNSPASVYIVKSYPR